MLSLLLVLLFVSAAVGVHLVDRGSYGDAAAEDVDDDDYDDNDDDDGDGDVDDDEEEEEKGEEEEEEEGAHVKIIPCVWANTTYRGHTKLFSDTVSCLSTVLVSEPWKMPT